jgi:hypothetical protein
MTYTQIRDGLASALEELDELVAVYPEVPDTVVAPSAAVIPGDPFAHWHQSASTGGTIMYRFDVVVFAARWDSKYGQAVVDRLIDVVPAAIERDQTLHGSASVVTVVEGTNYGGMTVADSSFVGCRFSVEVHA